MKRIIGSIFITGMLFFTACEKVDPPKAVGPIPTQKQLEWQEMEFYAFIHFTTNTFTNKEWGFGNESPEIFNPTELDCRQWARIVKDAGMKGIILTAKHHDGFCLWPSKYTDHSVEQSPWKDGKGDVVRELSEACKEYGLKFGLYLSPWDRNHPEYGRPGYVTYFRNQLHELLTNYGDVFEMWFDGANGGTGYYGGANERRDINTLEYYDWDETYKLIYEWSPNTLTWGVGPAEARWIGNESGYAKKTNWSMYRQKDRLAGKVHYKENMTGHEDGERWVPGEADVSIRPGWFYHAVEDEEVRSIETMVDIYYHTVGRNANLLLNFPVDRRGLIHENDEARLKEMVNILREDFKTELLHNTKATADTQRGGSRKYSATKAIDGDKETYWATDDEVNKGAMTFEFSEPTAFNRVLLQEYIKLGQRVRKFSVEAMVKGQWQTIANETTIGYKRILRTPQVTASALRINIEDARACPLISNVEAYNAPVFVRAPQIRRSGEGMVEITAGEGETVYFTTDGSEPDLKSKVYTTPFEFTQAGDIKALAYHAAEEKSSRVEELKCAKIKSGWKVLSVSNGDISKAHKMIDGNPRSVWKSGKESQLPLTVTIDMGEAKYMNGFSYLPKQVGNGLELVSTYAFYASTNKRKWIKLSEGEFSNIKHNPILQVKTFDKVKARYIRFVAKSEVEGGSRVSIGELDVLND
ncbi:MAG: alpha-L-fucosidase [Bacteroidales bacterium]|nr:alpha-L-fucosidase [Bacteroidales bacterium]